MTVTGKIVSPNSPAAGHWIWPLRSGYGKYQKRCVESEVYKMESIVSSSPKTFTLITGATGGLGKAFAVECASRGWNLYLTDLNPTALATLATSLHSTYGIQVQYGA